MDVFACIMYSMSSVGFFIIFFSLYLYICVPTKLSSFTRFVIHGHDLSSAIAQLYLTLGTNPIVLLPCASGYANGLFSHLGLMETSHQVWTLVDLIAINGSFSLLLTINRAFAVSQKMTKYKSHILSFFFFQVTCQIVCITTIGSRLDDGGEDGRQYCREMIKANYPIEMYTRHGVNYIPMKNKFVLYAVLYGVIFSIAYVMASCCCAVVLIRSVRYQAKSAQSPQFVASQRRITYGVLFFVFLETVGMAIPFIVLAICSFFSLGTPVTMQCACISFCVYPIFGPYYVLMSNTDYRNRVNEILRKARKMTVRNQTISTVIVSEFPEPTGSSLFKRTVE